MQRTQCGVVVARTNSRAASLRVPSEPAHLRHSSRPLSLPPTPLWLAGSGATWSLGRGRPVQHTTRAGRPLRLPSLQRCRSMPPSMACWASARAPQQQRSSWRTRSCRSFRMGTGQRVRSRRRTGKRRSSSRWAALGIRPNHSSSSSSSSSSLRQRTLCASQSSSLASCQETHHTLTHCAAAAPRCQPCTCMAQQMHWCRRSAARACGAALLPAAWRRTSTPGHTW